ncbi:MAG TPA: DUF1667 domain-containing protein [Thermoplasmatales archaeon]|nr:DUF1667 domain-containing protein [Thermoplasmatales archaeon]
MNRIICIKCPLGCKIKVENGKVNGNICKRGEEYAINEIKNPERILTTTVFIKNGRQKLLPVRSEKGLPKNIIKRCISEISKVEVEAPVRRGDVIIKNILGTGVNIIASRDVDKKGFE